MSRLKYPIRYFGGPMLARDMSNQIRRNRQFASDDFSIAGVETGIDGVKLDFNCGLRLQIPRGKWRVRIVDGASGLTFLDEKISATTLISLEKFYVEWEITLWRGGDQVLHHKFDPRGKKFISTRRSRSAITLRCCRISKNFVGRSNAM